MPIFVGSNSDDSRIRSNRVGFAVSTANPGSASEGDIYFNSSDSGLRAYDGSAWSAVGAGGGTFSGIASGSLANGQAVMIYSDGKVGIVTLNLTSENFIGFSDADYSDGDTATIQIAGSVDDAQSGLTTGSLHYVQTNGTLSTTAGDPSVFAGTALSATKIKVKK